MELNKIYNEDCLDKLKELDENSIDSVVTDPPYELGFMGKKWDSTGIAYNTDLWKEVYRVLKPGGHLLSFGGSRTYHRMAVAIEDAGFEIRDQIMWIYGSGFPKSHNIGKAVDKKPNADLNEFSNALKKRRIELGLSLSEADKLITGGTTMYSFLEGRKDNDVYPPNKEYWEKIKEHFGMDEWSSIIENNLKIVGEEEGSFGYQKDGERWGETRTLTETTTDLAKKWNGWGTALKPAHEPIVMARKPLSEKTVVDNVLEWGTGGINIDDSRIGYDENNKPIPQLAQGKTKVNSSKTMFDGQSLNKSKTEAVIGGSLDGRFPANVIFDEEAGKILDEQSGTSKSTGGRIEKKTGWGEFGGSGQKEIIDGQPGFGDVGGASRFFYCPKTSKRDRNEGLDEFDDKYYAAGNQAKAELKRGNVDFNANKGKGRDERHNHNQVGVSKNNHPTVKPTDLMLYLIRLVTPKGGTTLDPFMGSGSTGKAAVRGGFDFVGIEREKEYFEIAEARIQYEIDNPYNEETGKRVTVNKQSQKFW